MDLLLKLKRVQDHILRGSMSALIKFVLPFHIAAGVIFIMYLTLDGGTFAKVIVMMTAYVIPPAGKESVIPIAVVADVHPALAASSIAFIDIVTALFLVWNFDHLKRVPVLGETIANMERRGGILLEEHSRMRRFAFTGIVILVIIPFQGTGAVMASIIGRIIGMNPYKVFIAITIGALVGCFAIAYFIDVIMLLV